MGKPIRMLKARFSFVLGLIFREWLRQSSSIVKWTSEAVSACSTFKENDHLQSLHAHTNILANTITEPSRPVDLWKLLCSSDETGVHRSFCYGPTAGANNLKSRMKEKDEKDVYIFWQTFVEAEVCLNSCTFLLCTELDEDISGPATVTLCLYIPSKVY